MKKLRTSGGIAVWLFACATLFQGCLKDSATRTYTVFVPVYKPVAEVRSGIKSDAAMPITNPGKIFVLGNYIFLNEIDKGVHIIDNTNPEAPVNKYFVSIPGNLDLAVKGNTLYADLYRDLVTIDISNPGAIQVKKITEKVFPARTYSNWFVGDTTQVIVGWTKKDTTVDAVQNDIYYMQNSRDILFLSSASVIPGVQTKNGVSGSMARFTLLNDYLYTVTNSDLNVFNVAEPHQPVLSNRVNVGWQIETIYPFKNSLFIGSKTGVFLFDVSNPEQPLSQFQFSHITACDPVIADDDHAYVTLSSGTDCHGTFNELNILDIQDPQNPTQVVSYPLTNPHGLSKVGNTLFVCDGSGGLKVLDVADAANPVVLNSMVGLNALDIIVQNNNAIVVAEDGLYQYDYSSLNNLRLRSKLSVSRLK